MPPQSRLNGQVHTDEAAGRSVWLLARRLTLSSPLQPFSSLSDGRYSLCHWGILTTNLPPAKVDAYLKQNDFFIDFELGTLYQLVRTSKDRNIVRCNEPFLLSTLRREWRRPFGTPVGRTLMPHNDILTIGSLKNFHC
jgi:hypothetical protein